jgi:peptidylprolyl isomerase domain and WD repeat-containing protein 1
MPEAASSSVKRRSVTPEEARRRAAGGEDGKATKRPRTNGADSSTSLHLAALPNATRYQRSLMHRDTMSYMILTPFTNFLITASIDGHVKFWKKQESGIEFVKHYRAHLAPVVGLCTSADGKLAATISSDGTAKVYDVVNFDLINMITLGFTPRACCWVHKRGRADTILAISEEGSKNIHLFDGQGGGTPMSTIDTIHKSPCHLLTYNEPADCIISADTSGMIEYWTPSEPYELPKNKGLWEFKSRTDLFDFKKSKSTPTSLVFSQDYTKFVTISASDRQVRVYDFASGKMLAKYDESLKAAQEMQARAGSKEGEQVSDAGEVHLDDMEFGRRLATERDLDSSALDAVGEGVRACTGACTANAVFDESGRYITYGSMLGIKGSC